MSRDLRKYARQTNVRLAIGGIILISVIGVGLIYLFYGPGAALSGLLCLFIGLLPILLIIAIFSFMDWIVKREREK
jgi:hypothetical protein